MARVRHLTNAPITEAIIDFRVKGAQGFQVNNFLDLKPQLVAEFPIVEPQKQIERVFEFKTGAPDMVKKKEELQGYWFKSSDGLNIAQFRSDGFTFNRLKPYTSWEEVFPKAWKLWELYTKSGAAEFITRVAARYINRLTLPNARNDLAEYLTAPPRLPEGVTGGLSSFLTRIVLNIPKGGLTANVTHALEKGVDAAGRVVVILDIDAFKVKDYNLVDTTIPDTFAALRELKNSIFFSSITENTARLLE